MPRFRYLHRFIPILADRPTAGVTLLTLSRRASVSELLSSASTIREASGRLLRVNDCLYLDGLYKNNRSKSACTLNARKRLNNQAVWPVIFDITGPICARALKTKIPFTLGWRGHQDWPVMSVSRTSEFR